jgi:hypothetical protein
VRTQRGDRVPPHRLLHDSARVWQLFKVVGVGQPPVRYDAIDLGLSLPLDVHVLHHREEKDQERGMRLSKVSRKDGAADVDAVRFRLQLSVQISDKCAGKESAAN